MSTLFDDLVEGNLHASIQPIAGGILLWRLSENKATKIASFADDEALGLLGGHQSLADFNEAMYWRRAAAKETANA